MAEVQVARITLEGGQVVELVSPMKCPCGATAIRKKAEAPPTADITVHVHTQGGAPAVSAVKIGSDPTEYEDGDVAHDVPLGTPIVIDAVLSGGEGFSSWAGTGGVTIILGTDPGTMGLSAAGTLTLIVSIT